MIGNALGRAMLIGITTLGLAGITCVEARAAIQVSASVDRPQVRVGEQAVLTVEIDGESRDVTAPKLPALPDFEVYSGGQSQRFSFVNGQVSAHHSFTYYLRPRKEGKFRLGPIDVTVDGQTVTAAPVNLEVLAAGSTPAPTPSPPGSTAGDDQAENDMFVTMTVDKDSVVVGEQVVLTFGFYRAVRLSQFDSPEYTPPSTEGFWREDLPPDRHTTAVIRSRRFNVTEIQYALFPTHSGDLQIGEAVVRVPDDVFGSMLRSRRGRRRGPRVLTADPIVVHVAPLPPGAPEGFEGAVGSDLDLGASVDRRDLSTGEALTLTIRLEGDGYLPGMRAPQLEESDVFRFHDAGGGSESRPIGGRLHGVNTVQKLVVPREPGNHDLPGLRFVYFDTRRQDYVTLRTPSIPLRVQASEGDADNVYASGRKSEIELLSRDILHIEPIRDDLQPRSGPLPKRPVFWACLALPALVWVGSGQMAQRRRRLLSDPARLKARRALSRAEATLRGDEAIEQRVAGAVRGFIADKLDRAEAGLSEADLREGLMQRKVDATVVDSAMQLLARCDAARYAPGATPVEEWTREAKQVLSQLESGLRDES